MNELIEKGQVQKARQVQYAANEIIYKMCSCKGNMYGVIKAILKINEGFDIGGVRQPLPALTQEDMAIVKEAAAMVKEAVAIFC